MLFGQSAGATNVFIISSLPQATSLISSAISESGGGRDLATNAVLQSVGTAFATSLNCSVTDVRILLKSSQPS
jgi:carboxylesterase type B